ncbi:type II toxin-antitoxin system RelE/ParE family toxin [bacterium]|nr:type II toxin-antitoxin system RelE/ParE family toxin [bacterium]
MEKYKIEFTRSAKKELGTLPTTDIKKILKQIENLATNPRGMGCEKLAGGDGKYRVRQGNYRIVYSIQDDILTVLVIKISHRKDVYRH